MAVQNSLTKTKSNSSLGLSAYLTQDAVKNHINNVIGGKDGQRFISAIISATTTNPTLQECTNQSILSAALLGESLKLSPSPQLGQYYLVPFNDKEKGKVAQFQLGYKGYIQLAIRSGYYKKLNVLAIKKGELIRFDPLNEEIEVKLIEDEETRVEYEKALNEERSEAQIFRDTMKHCEIPWVFDNNCNAGVRIEYISAKDFANSLDMSDDKREYLKRYYS